MLRAQIESTVSAIVERLIATGELPEAIRSVAFEIQDTKSPDHGDYATNLALVAAKPLGTNPRALGEKLAAALGADPMFTGVEVAGPGFINFRLKPEVIAEYVPEILELGEDLPKASSLPALQRSSATALPEERTSTPLRINVEFVSVNPNGPITVGSGRGAAFGDTLCRVFEAAGHEVHREYYINDGVNSEQMRLFAESVKHYVREMAGAPSSFPEKGYRGEYVSDVASAVADQHGTEAANEAPTWFQKVSQELMIDRQRRDLALFGVEFDTWFSEQSLHDSGEVARRIEELHAKGAANEEAYRTKLKMGRNGVIEEVTREEQATEEEEGEPNAATSERPHADSGNTLWLRSTKFGDDMDRVLRRKDGRLTYIASDVAYHADKFNRPSNADKLITVLGPDHHGYIARLHAVLAALRMDPQPKEDANSAELTEQEALIFRSKAERDACRRALEEARQHLEVVIFQIVRFMKDGKPAPMRKRDGNIYELRDLIIELGQAQAPNASRGEQERIGADVARFFYLMRSHDTHMDFDIDLATKQSDENPVFYVQYAHARICSVIRKAEEAGLRTALDDASTLDTQNSKLDTSLLSHPRELALIKKILDLPEEVRRCATDYGVHRLTTYAVELARTYHHFYDACRVIQPDQPELSQARLALCEAARLGLQSTLALLGVSAPKRMDRAEAGG